MIGKLAFAKARRALAAARRDPNWHIVDGHVDGQSAVVWSRIAGGTFAYSMRDAWIHDRAAELAALSGSARMQELPRPAGRRVGQTWSRRRDARRRAQLV